MDRLFSLEQIQHYADHPRSLNAEIGAILAKQLADTIRENERLKAKIEGMEGAAEVERLFAEDKSNKESEHD